MTLSIMYYPSKKGGLFGRLGVGMSFLEVDKQRSGVGITAGLGFDVRLARNFYITPNLDWVFSFFYDTEIDPSVGELSSTNSIILLTVGVTWH
jgi:hypothetical protein